MSGGAAVRGRVTRRAVVALGVAVVVALVGACSERGAEKGAAAGDADARPRIVALSPAVAIMLSDLGLADRIVGRHAYDMALEKSVPAVGDQAGIDYEALLRVRPTHVLLQWGSREPPARLRELAGAHGWEVRDYPLLTLEDIRTAAHDLWARFGEPNAEEPPVLGAMERAWSAREGVFAGRVLLLASLDPPAALGPGSFHHQVLERLGGTPAIAEGAVYITLSAEDVLRLAPEGIVLVLPRAAGAEGRARTAEEVRALMGGLGRLDVPAVRAGRVALIDDPLALTPSTAMVGLADELARVLDGWAGEGGAMGDE